MKNVIKYTYRAGIRRERESTRAGMHRANSILSQDSRLKKSSLIVSTATLRYLDESHKFSPFFLFFFLHVLQIKRVRFCCLYLRVQFVWKAYLRPIERKHVLKSSIEICTEGKSNSPMNPRRKSRLLRSPPYIYYMCARCLCSLLTIDTARSEESRPDDEQ